MTVVVVSLLSVPQVPAEQLAPSDHVTPALVRSFCNAAVKLCVWFVGTIGVGGEIETEIAGGLSCTIAVSDLLESA